MHTMWKGSVSFGLVNIPVKMFAATEDKDVRFRYLHKACHTPIKYEKVCPVCQKEIADEEIVKGYEYEPGRFIILSESDFGSLQNKARGKNIEILDFVSLSEIDPIYFDKTYYLAPQDNGSKAYSLLLRAMGDTGKTAIARIMIRHKQSLAALRTSGNVLVLATIFHPDEVRPAAQVPGLPAGEDLNEKELDMAARLIDSLTAPFAPEKYQDDYRKALHELINQKIAGQEVTTAPAAPQKNVIDLLEALQASLNATRQEKAGAVPKKKKKAGQAAKPQDTALAGR